MLNFLKPLFRRQTTAGVVSDIFDKIDDLERISEQQELVYDQRQAQIDLLRKEQAAATKEGLYAEAVAAKLRSLVEEPVSE